MTGQIRPFLELLLKTSAESFLLLDVKGKILGLSQSLAKCLGYDPEQLVGKQLTALLAPEQKPPQLTPPPQSEQGLILQTRSGEKLHTHWLFVSTEDQQEEGGKKFLVGYLRDWASLPDVDRDSFLQETLRGHICDSLPVGVLVTDRQGRIMLYNLAQEMITGISRENALGRILFKDYASQAPKEAINSFDLALQEKVQNREHEFDYTDRFKNSRRLKTRISSLVDEKGEIHGVVQTLEDVSLPRLLEQQINYTRDFLKRLLDTTPNAIITTDSSGRITFNNYAADSLLGLEHRGPGEIRFADLLAGGAREAEQIMKLLEERSGEMENYETYLVDQAGKKIPISLTISFLYDEGAKTEGTFAIMRNLLLEKKLESEIRQNEQMLAAFIQDSPDAIITLDEKGLVKSWNHGAEKIFGYSKEEMIGQNLHRLIPPDSPTPELSGLSQIRFFQNGELKQYVTELLAANNKRLVVEATSTALKELAGFLTGRLIILRDITERARLEMDLQEHISDLFVYNEIGEALLSSNDLHEVLGIILIGVTAAQGLGFNRAFLLLLDHDQQALVGELAIGPSNPQEAGIIWADLQQKHSALSDLLKSYKTSTRGQDIYVNEIVRRIQIPLTETDNPLVQCFLEKKSLNVVNGVAMARFPQALAGLLGTDTMAIVPMVCEYKSVGLLLADNLINRRPIPDGVVRKLRVFANLASQTIERSRLFTSIEEKKTELEKANANLEKTNKELQESRDKLIQAERLSTVGEVAAHVAHEIRNPLVCIGGFARSLYKEIKDDDPKKGKLQIILDEVERLERYLRDTLTFIRPLVPEFRPTDLVALIQETFQMLSSEIDKSKVQIELSLMKNSPLLEIDPDQIRQVLLNIFRNALEAMPDGGQLTVSSNFSDGFYTISVADTGVGIDKQNMEKLFTAFFTTKSTGSGLGLTISSQIINNHGGTIGLSSQPGVGTVFHITLPAKHAGSQEE